MALVCLVLTFVVMLWAAPDRVVAQEQQLVSHARELYASADYEGALEILAQIGDAGTPSQRQAVREYRALCLLALNRTPEVEKVLGEIIEADPLYRPAADLTPPRLLAVFDRLHRQLLPSLARQRYSRAKTDLDEKRYTESADGFELVLRLINEAGAESDNADMQAIRTVAARDLEMSRTARDRKTPQPGQGVCRSADAGVTPPVPIRQDPLWQPAGRNGRFEGELEVVIDTTGAVQTATITMPIHPAYDRMLVEAARKWKYRSATKDGQPVSYCRRMTIALAPQRNLGSVSLQP